MQHPSKPRSQGSVWDSHYNLVSDVAFIILASAHLWEAGVRKQQREAMCTLLGVAWHGLLSLQGLQWSSAEAYSISSGTCHMMQKPLVKQEGESSSLFKSLKPSSQLPRALFKWQLLRLPKELMDPFPRVGPRTPKVLIKLPVVLQFTNYEYESTGIIMIFPWPQTCTIWKLLHPPKIYCMNLAVSATYLPCIGIFKYLVRFKWTCCWFSLCIHCTRHCVAWWYLHTRRYHPLNVFPPVSFTLSLFPPFPMFLCPSGQFHSYFHIIWTYMVLYIT